MLFTNSKHRKDLYVLFKAKEQQIFLLPIFFAFLKTIYIKLKKKKSPQMLIKDTLGLKMKMSSSIFFFLFIHFISFLRSSLSNYLKSCTGQCSQRINFLKKVPK